MQDSKEFDLGVILTLTSERIFTDISNVYDVLRYLTGDDIYSHQLSRVLNIAQKYALSLYPELKGVGNDVIINNHEDYLSFMQEQKKIFGDKLSLSPMPESFGYKYVDPIEEAIGLSLKNGK